MTASPLIPASWGEVIDKITILRLKLAHIVDPAARGHVLREYEALRAVAMPMLGQPAVAGAMAELQEINARLWRIEDDIRRKEKSGVFDETFIVLARSVYITNDLRAHVKRRINETLSSELREEKFYAGGDVDEVMECVNPPCPKP